MNDKIKKMLAFESLTEDEKSKKHILGRLYGPIADIVNPTRNGRKYSEQLWENVFNNPIMKEKFKNKVLYGELGHPADREEIDMEKVAVCMPEPPKKDGEGHLIGYFDILDTPNGRILKTLCDYGSTLGISSRGTGDLYTDDDGEEAVDPDTYDCECFDIVLVPAVESARLTFTEGLNKTKSMKQALCESLEKASDEDRKVMKEALENLDIHIEEPSEEATKEEVATKEDSNPEMEENIDEQESKQTNEELNEAVDDGSEVLIKSLQEALEVKLELENKIKDLQEQLAVSDTKVSKLEENLEKNKSTILRLNSLVRSSKDLTKKVSDLEEELKVKNESIDKLNKDLSNARAEKVIVKRDTSLSESLKAKDSKIKELNESLDTLKKEHDKEVNELKESLEKTSTQLEESKSKVNKLIATKDGYKNLANEAVDKFISLKARNLGVKPQEIKERLSKSYTISDVEKVCESLQAYELNVSKLPFNLSKGSKIKFNSTSKEVVNPNDDDYVDEDLLNSIKSL